MTEPTVPVPPLEARPSAAQPPPEAPPRALRRRSSVPVVAASLVAGLVSGLGGGLLAQTLPSEPERPVETAAPPPSAEPSVAPAAAASPVPGEDRGIPELSRSTLPSVALISIGGEQDGGIGQGSGFVIREDGYLLTNHHVITAAAESGEITVQLPGREPMTGEVVGSDATYDIAVLRVEADGLTALPFADSDQVQVGQTVVAVGAPLGLDSTVTSGIVSALDRPVVAGEARDLSYINAIQTDAAINPGNSGGPLLDLSGQVVGVNSAIAQLPSSMRGAGGSIGLGFAIPADQAERTAGQIIETGTSQHPVIGAHIDIRHTGEGARVVGPESLDVRGVIPGGPADEAGVQPGDLILAVDGRRVSDYEHLLVMLRSYEIGERIELLLRGPDGQDRTVELTLGASGD